MIEKKKTWCTQKYLKKVKSTEILIKRKSLETTKKSKSIRANLLKIMSPKKIGTPKRIIQLMSPGEYVEIKSDHGKGKYTSSRRIDFLD